MSAPCSCKAVSSCVKNHRVPRSLFSIFALPLLGLAERSRSQRENMRKLGHLGYFKSLAGTLAVARDDPSLARLPALEALSSLLAKRQSWRTPGGFLWGLGIASTWIIKAKHQKGSISVKPMISKDNFVDSKGILTSGTTPIDSTKHAWYKRCLH